MALTNKQKTEALTNDEKTDIAMKFVSDPLRWKPKDTNNPRKPIRTFKLCRFTGTLYIIFAFRNAKPGICIDIQEKDNKKLANLRNSLCHLIFPDKFKNFQLENRENQENGNQGDADRTIRRQVAFYHQRCETLRDVYRQIVDPGDNVDIWRAFFDKLVQKVSEVVGENPTYYGDLQTGNPSALKSNEVSPQSQASPSTDADGHLLPRNLIFFGAPGTGKSHKLKVAVEGKTNKEGETRQIINDDIGECEGLFVTLKDNKVDERHYERVTFYPTYSYAQFVGCYKPVMKGENIAYEFVPGPFLRVLVDSLKDLKDLPTDPKNHSHDHCLVIEEINRANAAAVFGDVFQMLDRGSNGESEYDVATSEDIKRYLKKELAKDDYKCAREFLGAESNGTIELDDKGEWKNCRLRIPSNMYIWATMNSADQGVFPLDTAFKRRWEFEYVGINDGWNKGNTEQPTPNEWEIADTEYYWEPVRRFINAQLSNNGVNEDKLMGPFFVKPATKNAKIVSADTFKSKVLMYLWEDAARMCRQKLFDKSIKVFSDLVHKWPKEKVFNAASDEETQKWKKPV